MERERREHLTAAWREADMPELQEPMPELRGERVVLRPLGAGHVEALRAIRARPEVAERWGPLEGDFPLDDEPAATRFAILVGGEVAGMIQYFEEPDPDYRYAALDIFLDPGIHGRGLGTEAIVTLVGYLTGNRGHHRITIDPAADNAVAIRSYEKAGFERVGVMRSSARDYRTGEWTDSLLMELVVLPDQKVSGR